MTPYLTVYNKFLAKIQDFKLLEMDDADVQIMMKGWLESAIANFRTCSSDLSNRDDEAEVDYVRNEDGSLTCISGAFNEDLTDLEIEILSILMVVEWLEPQLNSGLLTKQLIAGKDFKFFAQANHLKELMELQEKSNKKARLLLNRYRLVNNTYLDEE